MKGESKTSKSLAGSIVIIVLLAIGLCVTTFALFWTSISAENNIFRTGLVKINLNDGNPVIKEHEFLFEPGMTVEKTFFIENQSTDDVYYKLYFENVEGGLAKVLLISISTEITNCIQERRKILTKTRSERRTIFCG